MVVSCCVINCTNRFDKYNPRSFYRIPKKPDDRRKSWIAAIKRVGPNGQQWEPTDHDRICFLHFITEQEDVNEEDKLRLVVTGDEKFSIISSCHDLNGSHLGVDKTIFKINDRYYWKGIVKDVREYVKKCDQCQKCNKKTKTTKLEMEPVPPTWKKIAIDLIGPYNDDRGNPLSNEGYRYVLTVIDLFSNYTEAFPLYTKKVSEIAEKLYVLFCRHGVPLEMISDNGREFTSSLSSLIDEKYGYKHITITPYNPRANGKCEKVNLTIKNMLNKSVIDGESWERLLPSCLFAYNTAKHASAKYSPFFLMYWRNPILPNEQSLGETANTITKYRDISSEEIEKCANRMFEIQNDISGTTMLNVDSAQAKQKHYFDKRHNVKENEFQESDVVLVKNHRRKKRMQKQNWLGPYQVKQIVKNGTFRINDFDNNLIGTFKQMNLKKYNETISQGDDGEETIDNDHECSNPPDSIIASAEVHKSDCNSEQSDKQEHQESQEFDNSNNSYPLFDMLDDSIFLTQNVFQSSDEDKIEVIEENIETTNETERRPKRKCREKKRQSSTKSNDIEHPDYVPSINMGYSSESDWRIDEMNSSNVQPNNKGIHKRKRKMEKVTSSESTCTPLMRMVSSYVKNTKGIMVPVKTEILEQPQSEVLPSCSNPNFQESLCSSYRTTVESSGSNVNNMCSENQNLGAVANENNSGLIYNIKQEPVDDYFVTNVYNESQDCTQNSVVNSDSQTNSFSPIIYDNVNSNDHKRKMKEVASFSQLNKTHLNQEKQSSTPTMVFRHAKNIQKTIISDSMGGNSSHNMRDNSSHNTGDNSTTNLFSNQFKVPRLQTKDSGTDRLHGNQSLEPQLDNTDWRNNCLNFLKDALKNTINRLEDLGVEVAAWVLIPNNDKSSLIHHMGSKKGTEFVKSKPDINTELHLFLENYKKKDNGKKNNSKEISKKKLEVDSCSVEFMETSSYDGKPPESISENKAIPCSSLNDCKPTNVLFSVKGLDDNSSCIVIRQVEESSKEELQVNTPCTSSSNEKEKIQVNMASTSSSNEKEKIQVNTASMSSSNEKEKIQVNTASTSSSNEKEKIQVNTASTSSSNEKEKIQVNTGSTSSSNEKEKIQLNTASTSSSNEKEKIQLKRKIDSVDTDPLSEC